ncbi:MAG: hypothetical protein Q7J20_00565 [Candidatus Nitrotoga sp.]|nr:hypothetical protein [Candidatus Nitrotoga sp.]MDO9446408.1 hypothetical protein [Candidatus Nitrotoga sp.]
MTMLHKQRGSTLLVALVMLMLLTLVALSAMNASTTSIEVVGNAQFREEANAAAQQAIERVISSNFTVNPASFVEPTNTLGTPYISKIDCKSTKPLDNAQLDASNPEDAVCLSSGSLQNTGVMNASGVLSTTQPWCYQQTWEVNATVNDSDTGASTSVHQGVSLRVPAGTDCP